MSFLSDQNYILVFCVWFWRSNVNVIGQRKVYWNSLCQIKLIIIMTFLLIIMKH